MIMKVYVNGQSHDMPNNATIMTLIEKLALTGKRIAVELNQQIVPRSEHAHTFLHEGDQLEIVHAIGGG